MNLKLSRLWVNSTCTQGLLYVDGVQQYFSLERSLNDPEHPAIPVGRYPVVPYPSPHFGRTVPLLQDVPGREDIEIHPANVASELKGCIALGLKRYNDTMILESRLACDALFQDLQEAWAKGEQVWIEVVSPDAATSAAT